MNQVFVDTVHWIAIFSPTDNLHETAEAAQGNLGTGVRFVTTDFVLTEFLNSVASMGKEIRDRAVSFVRRIQADADCDVIPASRTHFDKAFRLFSERADQDHSLTDCVSIVVMKERGVTDVLSTDRCFRTEGLNTILRS